jgi:hypothetical protein
MLSNSLKKTKIETCRSYDRFCGENNVTLTLVRLLVLLYEYLTELPIPLSCIRLVIFFLDVFIVCLLTVLCNRAR